MFVPDLDRKSAALAVGLLVALLPVRVHAATLLHDTAIRAPAVTCASVPADPLAADGMAAMPMASKSMALLGGQVSALDRMRMLQEHGSAPVDAGLLQTQAPPAFASLAPAVGGERAGSGPCSEAPISAPLVAREPGEFLASRRLPIGRSPFDDDWRRVKREQISLASVERLVGPAGEGAVAKLAAVNRWVNRNIAFAEDRDLFARADYWAGAGRTLELRRGDCEDIALTKMQMLAAAGFPRDDMILTIARDLVRNADHAFLVVRHEGRFYLLDNATDELLDAAFSHDYRPVLSFAGDQAWLHGY